MLVCAHGDVDEFCKDKDIIIIDRYDGDLEKYNGLCRVIVSDVVCDVNTYNFLKGKMLVKGYELVSTIHTDINDLAYLIAKSIKDKSKKHGGRHSFGFQNICGEIKLTDRGRAVVNRIFELRDLGYTYKAISEDEGVCHPDGRRIHLSTIQIIIQNREKYEKER